MNKPPSTPTVVLTSLPRPHPEVVSQILEGEAVLVQPSHGAVKVINELGAFLWSHLGSGDVASLVAQVCAAYEVDPETAQADTLAFLQELLDREIITLG